MKYNSETLSEIIPALEGALASTAWHVQKTAANILGLLAAKAKSSVPKLVAALASDDMEVQDAVVAALGRINTTWWTMPETKSAIIALSMITLEQHSVDKKIPFEITSLVTRQIKASAASLLDACVQLGFIFTDRETNTIIIALELALVNRSKSEGAEFINYIVVPGSKPIAVIVSLVQILTYLKAQIPLQPKSSKTREIAFKHQHRRVNKSVATHQQLNNGYRSQLFTLKHSRLLVTIVIVGIVWWVSITEISKIKDVQSRYKSNRFQGVVMDNVTGMMWQYCTGVLFETDDGSRCVFTSEFKFLYNWDEIRPPQSWGFRAGYNDWHVPNITELRTLVYCSSEQPKRWNDTGNSCEGYYRQPTIILSVFKMPKISGEMNFWSSSTDDNGNPLLIDFNTGKQFSVNLDENENFQAYKFLVRTAR